MGNKWGQSEEIESVGSPTVKSENCGVRALTFGFVDCVNESHVSFVGERPTLSQVCCRARPRSVVGRLQLQVEKFLVQLTPLPVSCHVLFYGSGRLHDIVSNPSAGGLSQAFYPTTACAEYRTA